MNDGVVAGLTDDFRKLARRAASTARRTRVRADREAIHDLRVVTRRLNAWLDLWKPALRARRRRELRRGLRRLRRSMGEAREAQVHEAMLLERLGPGPQAALAGTAELLEGFTRRTAKLERRASVTLIRPRVRRLLRALSADPPLVANSMPLDAALMARAHARAERLTERARSALVRARQSDEDGGHAARIAVKRIRYVLERMRAGGAHDPAPTLGSLAEAQESLGRVHDLATLTAALERDRARSLERGRPERARAASILLLSLDREAREARAAGLGLEVRPPQGSTGS